MQLIKSHLQINMSSLRLELTSLQRQYNQLIDILLQVTDAMSHIQEHKPLSIAPKVRQEYQIVEVPRRIVVYTRYSSDISIDTYLSFIHRYAELLNIVDQNDLAVSGPISVVFHEHYQKQFSDKKGDRMGDLEISLNVESGGYHPEYTRLFGGYKAAMAVHVGPYTTTLKTYQGLEQWAEKQGYTMTGQSVMELVVGRTRTDKPENFVTKLYLPVNVTSI